MAVHLHLGYATLAEYVERVLGYDGRMTAERLRVAEALESLPLLSTTLLEGRLSWSAVRELTRVAAPETEEAWLAAAAGRTVRQIEEAVAGHRPGDRPEDAADPGLRRQVIRLELSPEALALFREAVTRLRRDVDARLSDEEAVMEMARQVLGGPADEGRAPYQVAVTVCDGCGRTWQDGRGEHLEVPGEVAERAACDAQQIGTHVGAGRPARATQTIPPAVRRSVVRRDGGRCRVPGCRNVSFLEVHHVIARAEGGDHRPDGLLLLCGAHHRLLHRGFLVIDGTAPQFAFRHADGTHYGNAPTPAAVEATGDAFSALRNLGLRDGEAKRALAAARTHVGAGASVPDLVRAALRAHHARPTAILPPPIATLRESSPSYGRRRRPRAWIPECTAGREGLVRRQGRTPHGSTARTTCRATRPTPHPSAHR